MMRKSLPMVAGALLFMTMLSGCAVSLHPLGTEETIVEESKILGEWTEVDGNSRWDFAPPSKEERANHYHLTVRDFVPVGTDGMKSKLLRGDFIATVVKIKDVQFLDLVATDMKTDGKVSDLQKATHVKVHTFLKMKVDNEHLVLYSFNQNWLQDELEANPKAVAHTIIDGRVIFTAKPEQLQKFIAKHLDNPKAFKKIVSLEK